MCKSFDEIKLWPEFKGKKVAEIYEIMEQDYKGVYDKLCLKSFLVETSVLNKTPSKLNKIKYKNFNLKIYMFKLNNF